MTGSDLKGQVAVITGASSGIGEALARQLSGQGVCLGLGSRRGTELGLPGALAKSCDVRDRGQVEGLVGATVERFGRLDILVANAGVGSYGQFLDTPQRHIDEMIDTNVKGTINLIRAGLPHLIGRGSGDIITVSSEAGRRGLPGEAVYSASKFAQVGLTRALDGELREHGIRCTSICPGGVATEFALDDGRGRTPEFLAGAGMMTAEDIAEVIVFALTRPRRLRILETALRPMTEASWG
jgi:3-oxoacyl-[acyl-carrier protein] reductase